MKTRVVFVMIVAMVAAVAAYRSSDYGKDAVLLRDVEALTFKRGKYTNARRVAPIPQLNCLGSACYSGEASSMLCRNVGWNGREVQWKCEAELDDRYKLGEVTVSCEGYNHPDDPYVLAGSCGAEYSLEHTANGRSDRGYGAGYSYPYSSHSSDSSFSFFWLVVFALIGYGLYRSCTAHSYSNVGSAANYPAAGPSYPDVSAGVYPSASYSSGPGFWSGLTTGGILGYLFGRPTYYSNYPYGTSRMTSYRPWSFSSTGNYGSSSRRSNSSTHTSTAYGGTRNR